MFRKTPIAWLCAALFASSALHAATPATAPLDAAGSDSTGQQRAEARLALMPELGVNDADFPLESIAISEGDLWERIRNGFSIPELNSPLVARHAASYAEIGRAHV